MKGTESPVLQTPGRIPGAGKWPVKSAQTGLSAGLPHSLGTMLGDLPCPWLVSSLLSPTYHLACVVSPHGQITIEMAAMRDAKTRWLWSSKGVQESLSSLPSGQRWAQTTFFGFVKSLWHCCTLGLARCTKARLGHISTYCCAYTGTSVWCVSMSLNWFAWGSALATHWFGLKAFLVHFVQIPPGKS